MHVQRVLYSKRGVKRRNLGNALKSGIDFFPPSRYFSLRRRLKGLVK
jgi:hypothetical protein